jgi:hypothetical protein
MDTSNMTGREKMLKVMDYLIDELKMDPKEGMMCCLMVAAFIAHERAGGIPAIAKQYFMGSAENAMHTTIKLRVAQTAGPDALSRILAQLTEVRSGGFLLLMEDANGTSSYSLKKPELRDKLYKTRLMYMGDAPICEKRTRLWAVNKGPTVGLLAHVPT